MTTIIVTAAKSAW